MRFEVSYEHKINLGNYENFTVGLSMEYDTDQSPVPDALRLCRELVEGEVAETRQRLKK